MTISRLMTAAAVAGLVVSSASMAADAQRPTVTSYAAPAAAPANLGSGVRAGARTRRGSALDGGSDMVMGGGAGAGVYFLVRALNNNGNNNNDPASPQ